MRDERRGAIQIARVRAVVCSCRSKRKPRCQEREVDLGVLGMQFSLRNEIIAATIAGPRTVGELEDNYRYATTPVPAEVWEELVGFLATLEPATPGGETLPSISSSICCTPS